MREVIVIKQLQPECLLRVPRHIPAKPRFPVIDIHTHWGKLLGAMEQTEHYFDLYETKDAVAKIKSHGVQKVVNLDGFFGEELCRVREKLRGEEDFFIHFGQVDVERFEEAAFEKMVYQAVKQLHADGVRGLKFWKVIGLGLKDSRGGYLRPDDARLGCIWQAAAEFHMPVLFHIGDLNAFFTPIDEKNEYRDTLLLHPEWSFNAPGFYSFAELMAMQENLLSQNPKTQFIIAHMGSYAENLAQVGRWLDTYPNMHVDIADRLNELGRQPYTARAFFNRYADRIVFGTDLLPTDIERYPIYWEFLETFNEYFPYRTERGIALGNWNIYGIGLEDAVLQKIYYENAAKLLKEEPHG